MEKTVSASARKKKFIDKPVKMQTIHYKELMSSLRGRGGAAVQDPSGGRKKVAARAIWAARPRPDGRAWHAPVNNCCK